MKVFLVEDEFVIREGIKKNIDWEGAGYNFVGEAGDGELALPLIKKTEPDILITDIKMPFMNGLELSRLVKQQLPDTEIIILSGYDEFEYAKEGINIGVADYLLKPVNGAELLASVDTVRDHIIEKQKERELYEHYKRETAENFLKEKKDFFDDLVKGQDSIPNLLERATKLELDITALCYNVVLFMTVSVNHEAMEYSNTVQKVMERLNKMANEKKVLVFDRDSEGSALLFMADTKDELERKQNAFLSELEGFVKQYSNIRYFAGIGESVSRLRELPESYNSAGNAYAHRFLMGNNRFVSTKDIEEFKKDREESLNLNTIDPKQVDSTKIKDFLRVGDADETEIFVKAFFDELGNAAKSQLFRQYIVMNSYFAIVEFLDGINADRSAINDVSQVGNTQMSLSETVKTVTSMMLQAIELRDSQTDNKNDNAIEKVKLYIEENYAEATLSLSDIAAYVNFSPNHLSMVFRQQTGQTLIKYLTDIRLGKAKELLKCSNLKSSEIGEKVGYLDPHYFSYLFKKTMGMTPTQYREGN